MPNQSHISNKMALTLTLPVRLEREQPEAPQAASKAIGYAGRRWTILPLPFVCERPLSPLRHLVVNPPVGLLQAVPQPSLRLPVQIPLDQRVVAVAPVHSFGRFQVISPFQLHARDLLDNVHQPVDRHQFITSEIDWLQYVAGQDRFCPFQAIVDIHETARLMSIPPDLNLVPTGKLRLNDFSA